jgi:uncharacterized repeat protein (TIGR01451 family)
MRTTWKRAVAGLLLAGVAGSAALGLARPTDPPAVIPPADGEPTRRPDIPVVYDSGVPIPVAGQVIPVQAVVPASKNDPAVALDWSGPAVVKVHQPTEYTLAVRNVCGQSLQKVVVQVRTPNDVSVKETSPAAKPTDGVYLWELGTLDAKGSQAIKLTMSQASKGDLNCQAWVTFTGTSAMKVAVKEPKLAVTIKAPEKVILGDKIPVEYAVTNPGDYTADSVMVKLAESTPAPRVERALKPGESFRLTEEFVTASGGTFTYEAVATGADGLKASAKATVQVLVPKLDVSVTGPTERLIGKKAPYTITVRNCGDVPVTGVIVREHVPAAFRVSATGDGVLSAAGDRLSWSVGDLAVGAMKKVEFEGVCSQPGTLNHKADATGDRGTSAAADYATKVQGIPALRMEMVDSTDPVEKDGETVYEIKVTNTGTQADSDVRIECELPKEFEFVSANGPTKGQEMVRTGLECERFGPEQAQKTRVVVFDPISDLAPKTEAVFKVKVKATTTGDVRFKAVMTSKHLTTPVTKEESTRVYGE